MKELTGQWFDKLTAIRITDMRKGKYVVWECRSGCGETVSASSHELRYGKWTSCGCAGAGQKNTRLQEPLDQE